METSEDQVEILTNPSAKARKSEFLFKNLLLGSCLVILMAALLAVDVEFFSNGAPEAATSIATNNSSQINAPIQPASSASEPSDYYHGVDISHYQTDFESEITPEDGLTFAICKATQGIQFVDSEFKSNWSLATEKGLIKGAYHFYVSNDDPVAQANLFISTVGQWGPKDIAPIIDLEPAGIPAGSTPTAAEFQAGVQQFLDKVEEACSCTPMIYSGKYFVNQYLNDPSFARYPLWFAEYTSAAKPSLPTIWAQKGYKIWQKSDTQDINSTTVDFDVYYGPKSGLWQK